MLDEIWEINLQFYYKPSQLCWVWDGEMIG